MEKQAIILRLIFYTQFDNTSLNENRVLELETRKFWNILLKYTNINVDEYEHLCTYDNYDICFALMGDWLLTFVEKDYNRIIKMIDDIINLNSIQETLYSLENIDIDKLQKYNKDIETMLNYFNNNSGLIKELSEINKLENSNVIDILNANSKKTKVEIK
jgi:hypothetical protein